MKKLKRILSAVICATIICCILVSCSDNTGTSSSASSFADVSIDFSQAIVIPSSLTTIEQESMDKYGHIGNPDIGYEVMEGERDPWLWPFSRTSIWNMPIGSDAEYKPADFVGCDEVSCDTAYFFTTTESDEVLTIVQSTMSDRWPSDITNYKKAGTTYWPRGITISKDSPMNDCSAILQPDGRTIIELQPTCRDEATSTYVIGNPRTGIDIYEDGILGTHWGSGLSALGGAIRLGELTGDEPIRHALKLNVNANRYLYYDYYNYGYTWPADRSDTTPETEGTKEYLVEGSLLAIPRNITPESVGITNELVKKLFVCCQDYGIYIVDDTVRDAFSISADIEESAAVKEKYGINLHTFISSTPSSESKNYAEDFMKMIECLQVVVNNSETTVGGGGTPCQPLAPNLPSIK